MKKLGFIGFGEAAYYISIGLHSEGDIGIAAYDIMADSETMGGLINSAKKADVKLYRAPGCCRRGGYCYCCGSVQLRWTLAVQLSALSREIMRCWNINAGNKRRNGAAKNRRLVFRQRNACFSP